MGIGGAVTPLCDLVFVAYKTLRHVCVPSGTFFLLDLMRCTQLIDELFAHGPSGHPYGNLGRNGVTSKLVLRNS